MSQPEQHPRALLKIKRMNTGEANIYAKLESFNPMSSAKDRAALTESEKMFKLFDTLVCQAGDFVPDEFVIVFFCLFVQGHIVSAHRFRSSGRYAAEPPGTRHRLLASVSSVSEAASRS